MPRHAQFSTLYTETPHDWPTLHAAAALTFALAVSSGASLGVSLPVFGQLVVFAVLTAVVGIPHGGLDHRFGRAVCGPWAGKWWPGVFFLSYLSVGLSVLAGWTLMPLTTIAAFFLLAAIHFGEEESLPMSAVEGGMVIWIPFLARPREATSLLSLVCPGEMSGSLQNALSDVRPLLWVLALVLTGRVSYLAWVGLRDRERGALLKACRLAAFTVLFATAPVLIGFVAYFCGWHSTRELGGLANRVDPGRPSQGLMRVIRMSAPLSILLIVATVLAACWRFANGHSLEAVVLQAGFLTLSAVAVPHILLHKIAARLRVDPFFEVAQS